MASPAAFAPSPAMIAPAPPTLVLKTPETGRMASVSLESAMVSPGIGPTKNWVIPPRPKPGRKPATDTPPTKRKAQNRAAQRAFRERRAARVGELEEQLKETEEERQKRESAMHDRIAQQTSKITKLEEDVQRLSNEATTWRDRYFELQRDFEDERSEKDLAQTELAYLRNGARATGTSAVPLPPRRQRGYEKTQPDSMDQQNLSLDLPGEHLGCGDCTASSRCVCVETAMSMATAGCDKCTVESPCECLNDALKTANLDPLVESDLKRPLSAAPDSDETKRTRLSIEDSQQQEIDFTTQFSQARPILVRQRSSQDLLGSVASRVPADSCGFCAEGTYCACAEAAGVMNRVNDIDHEHRLAPLLSEVTPPPSDTDVTSADTMGYKLLPLHPNHRIHNSLQSRGSHVPVIPNLLNTPEKAFTPMEQPTMKGPGSCKQCQEDPRSGLFCRSLAAMRGSTVTASDRPGECCGGANSSGGGCCKTQNDGSTVKLSCADTYKTLSTHKKFDQASDNIGDWLPKLHTSLPRYPGRAPLDIEAASVISVIKYFDVRFGRN